MKEVVVYNVSPNLPDRLRPLMDLAKNLWFCWNLEVIDLFRSMDQNLWEETGHNPLAILGRLGNDRIQELLEDDGFLLEMDRITAEFKRYVGDRRAYDFGLETPFDFTVAYFSAEYGLTDCLPIYSGGLGILSGDHLKSASDLCVPLVAVGLLYQKGYFRQYLNVDGWQQETYPENDFHVLPVILERDEKGDPLTIEVPIRNRNVKVRSLAHPGGQGSALHARYEHDRELGGRPGYHLLSLRRRQGDAPETGDRPGNRRGSGLRTAGHSAGRLSHERRPFGLRPPRDGFAS